ncbi:MAG: FG-GAP-like repeat-containing protein, partial [Bacteroidota bacterium]|nr:FG-GAP-like repeat-containing protein [Bacteroidota bacterium]
MVATAQFGAGQVILPAENFPALEAIDLDDDGDLDLITLSGDQNFKWAENTDGAGTLAGLSLFLNAGSVTTYAFGDIDLNGTTDLVFVDDENSMRSASGNGGGDFSAPALVAMLSGEAGKLVLEDVTGDDLPEIVVSIFTGSISRIAVIPNVAGTFGTPGLLSPQIEGAVPSILLVGEFDGMGGKDILFMNEMNAAIGLLNVNGDGSEWQEMTFFNLFDYLFVDPELIDVDGDGDLDIAEAHQSVV